MARSTIIGVSIMAALTLSACGGRGSPRSGASSSHKNAQLALAECMRAHGVTNFPDPTQGPGGTGISISAAPGSSTLTVDGVTMAGPTFTSAERACKLFGGATRPPPISEKMKEQLFGLARCMRAHGVPSWADPTFPANGGVMMGGPSNPSQRNSPALLKALRTCNRLVGL
ncbi:MAG TPA: hypothetical protein VG321_06360 [Solirubrobacteraceae bacterium]|jgi:hypothetical protein|nr:hypothetical protein [Solirubrobacteraceae bacterium]